MIKLLITVPCKEAVQKSLTEEFSGHYDMVFAQENPDIIARELKDAEVVIGEPDPALLPTAKQLKWMQITWAGADRYTRSFPEGITLTNASGAFGRIISEYTLGMILAQYKRLPGYYVNQKKKIWADLGCEKSLLHKRVLILGTGNVGASIAQKLHAFGTYNIGLNRSGRSAEHFDEVHTMDALDSLLPQADILVGALPKTPGTVGLLDGRRMRLMQKDSLLVNVGRGTMIVTGDLETLLEEGHFYGVVLDVMDPEPLPDSSPMWSCDRVLLTPHISGIGFDHEPATEAFIWDICRENLRRYAANTPLTHVVDVAAGY
jgi:phosphoglycerate dehydrogenase-like enzyme